MNREQLLNNLFYAKSLMVKCIQLQQQITGVKQSMGQSNCIARKKPLNLFVSILISLVPAYFIDNYFIRFITGTIVSAIMGNGADSGKFNSVMTVIDLVVIGSLAVAGGLFLQSLTKKKAERANVKIDAQNVEIQKADDVKNAQKVAQLESLKKELYNVQTAYANQVAPWYPQDYCTLEAIDFLCNAVRNCRADSVKEAVNLYENYLHQRTMEEKQQQMLNNQQKMYEQQKLNNILQVGQIVMQGATIGAINSNTCATVDAGNQITGAVNAQGNSINSSINYQAGRINRNLGRINGNLNSIRSKM